MRTTLTLDDDIAAKLKRLSRRTGRAFREVVNDVLRRGLATQSAPKDIIPFRVQARDLGALKPGLSLHNVGALIEEVEGPLHR